MRIRAFEDRVQVLTTFEYKVYDQFHSGFVYDSNPQQIADFIRRTIHGTADFKRMTEFHIKSGTVVHVNLKNIVRKYEEGSSEDPSVIEKRKARAKDDFIKNNTKILGGDENI